MMTTLTQRGAVDPDSVHLRPVTPADFETLFEFQSDPESNAMAGTKPRTRETFFTAWQGIIANPAISAKVIEIELSPAADAGLAGAAAAATRREVVGNISRFVADDLNCVGYWIARHHWGKGIASRALALFLADEPLRPLHATADRRNTRSHRILEKCGFRCTGHRTCEETERFLAREIADFVLD